MWSKYQGVIDKSTARLHTVRPKLFEGFSSFSWFNEGRHVFQCGWDLSRVAWPSLYSCSSSLPPGCCPRFLFFKGFQLILESQPNRYFWVDLWLPVWRMFVGVQRLSAKNINIYLYIPMAKPTVQLTTAADHRNLVENDQRITIKKKKKHQRNQ